MKQGALCVHCVCLCAALEGPWEECGLVGTKKHDASIVPGISSLWAMNSNLAALEHLLMSRHIVLFSSFVPFHIYFLLVL